jgi:hypothetical protein
MVVSQNMFKVTEEKHEEHQSIQTNAGRRHKSGISWLWSTSFNYSAATVFCGLKNESRDSRSSFSCRVHAYLRNYLSYNVNLKVHIKVRYWSWFFDPVHIAVTNSLMTEFITVIYLLSEILINILFHYPSHTFKPIFNISDLKLLNNTKELY